MGTEAAGTHTCNEVSVDVGGAAASCCACCGVYSPTASRLLEMAWMSILRPTGSIRLQSPVTPILCCQVAGGMAARAPPATSHRVPGAARRVVCWSIKQQGAQLPAPQGLIGAATEAL